MLPSLELCYNTADVRHLDVNYVPSLGYMAKTNIGYMADGENIGVYGL